ncbi:ABC transporter ATP-binding protein [Treponema primitia]|uniref:ABC transporter ATP-binding protein n=1 Tax=Treponema primitia TaxID=88058 RepID=UPI0002555012|nr:ABC transporter ATP-binding protein [Treponema primitia]
MITVQNLSFSYLKNKPIIEDISFTAGKGEIINILGPNGCGKTTLLKIMLGFMPTARNMISIDGTDIRDINRSRMAKIFSYVPQLHLGVFSYPVLDVVLMGRVSMSPWYKYNDEDYRIAHEALEKMGLTEYSQRLYLHLSGGERQLVLIARALAQGAQYFIMDEPVSGLDYGNQFLLLQVIRDLAEQGQSIILTTHHPEHALFLGGRALLIKHGRVMADGPTREVINTDSICALYNMPRELLKDIWPN